MTSNILTDTTYWRSPPWWMRSHGERLIYAHKMEPLDRWVLMREMARTDLHYLLDQILDRPDTRHPWIVDRIYEVQASPNQHLDLWAREHYKSTIITFAKTLQDVLASHGRDPLPGWQGIEPTFGIFSFSRPIAKKFARQLKIEFESNDLLRWLFPDIIWNDCRREAPVWSLDDGLVLKRKSNPKEATIEAWGLVDSQPTSAHFHVRVYDDVVTRKSVTLGMVEATTEAWELSLNLGVRHIGIERYIGTRYHFHDSYGEMMRRNHVEPRIYPATDTGKPEGTPVLLSRQELDKKRTGMGSFTFSCQMLQDPIADEKQGFRVEDLRFYDAHPPRNLMNVYMMVDPANEKHKRSDYTAGVVVGCASDGNFYLLDMWRARLNLQERAQALMLKHRYWRPDTVGYEKYGMQADTQYIAEVMEREHYRFELIELGGPLGNFERVRRLIPTHQEHRWWYPKVMPRTDEDGMSIDMMQVYIREEYEPFPVGVHVDIMDAQSRIFDEDMGLRWPSPETAVAYHKPDTSWVV